MKSEFCRVLTDDGLELQGLFMVPARGPSDTTVIHTHGLDGNFYENRFIDHLANECTGAGVNFITFNNRGHDYISDFIVEDPKSGETSYVQIGGIYEMFEDCISDISAWIEFAASRGTRRFVFQGHSHGALKSVYFLSQVDLPGAAGLILLSPSDDFGKQREDLGPKFDEALGLSQNLVGEGRELELMPHGMFHYPISARSYLDIYRPGSPVGLFNLSRTDRREFPELEAITVPVLTVVGSVEEQFIGEPDAFLRSANMVLCNADGFEGTIVEGAPHNYLGFGREVGERVGAWLRAFLQRSGPPGNNAL
jgi:pimeloyl-ACP methyl ester carboxylesterase